MLVVLTSLLLVGADVEKIGPGTHTRELTVDSRQRSYLVHVPRRERRAEANCEGRAIAPP